jgi:hypothetical protein
MKPVAWMDKNGVPSSVKSELYNIPLYTAPQTNIKFNQTLECPSYLSGLAPRELSDEEIEELYYSIARLSGQGDFKYIQFARAILKKASEK